VLGARKEKGRAKKRGSEGAFRKIPTDKPVAAVEDCPGDWTTLLNSPNRYQGGKGGGKGEGESTTIQNNSNHKCREFIQKEQKPPNFG